MAGTIGQSNLTHKQPAVAAPRTLTVSGAGATQFMPMLSDLLAASDVRVDAKVKETNQDVGQEVLPDASNEDDGSQTDVMQFDEASDEDRADFDDAETDAQTLVAAVPAAPVLEPAMPVAAETVTQPAMPVADVSTDDPVVQSFDEPASTDVADDGTALAEPVVDADAALNAALAETNADALSAQDVATAQDAAAQIADEAQTVDAPAFDTVSETTATADIVADANAFAAPDSRAQRREGREATPVLADDVALTDMPQDETAASNQDSSTANDEQTFEREAMIESIAFDAGNDEGAQDVAPAPISIDMDDTQVSTPRREPSQAEADTVAGESSIESVVFGDDAAAQTQSLTTVGQDAAVTSSMLVAPVAAPVTGTNTANAAAVQTGVQPVSPANNAGANGSNLADAGARQSAQAARNTAAARPQFTGVMRERQDELIHQVARAINLRGAMRADGRVSLLLRPEHLGTLKLELNFDRNGRLTVEGVADNAATRHLLAGSSEELRAALRQHHVELVKFSIENEGRDNGSASNAGAGGQESRGNQERRQTDMRPEQLIAGVKPRGTDDVEQDGPLEIGAVDLTA